MRADVGGSWPWWPSLALVATGCDTEIKGDDGDQPVILVVSESWVANHQGSARR